MAQNVERLHPEAATLAERAIVLNDLSEMKPDERVKYYMRVCETLGLNPLTGPFAYIELNGELKLYAKKDATEQLRRIYHISVKVTDRSFDDGIYTVAVQTSDPSGREDEDIGAVVMAYPKYYWENRSGKRVRKEHPKAGQPFEGEDKANAMMKATTKAKRRATLSHCGLGFLDESEISDIPQNEIGGLFSPEQMHGERLSAEIKPFPANRELAEDVIEPDEPLALDAPEEPFWDQESLQLPLAQDDRFGEVDWNGFAGRMITLIASGTGHEGRLARLRAANNEALKQCKESGHAAYRGIVQAFQEARARTPAS